MNIKIVICEADLKKLILKELYDTLGTINLSENDLRIEVKSKQNYKSEWEKADFRAIYEK